VAERSTRSSGTIEREPAPPASPKDAAQGCAAQRARLVVMPPSIGGMTTG